MVGDCESWVGMVGGQARYVQYKAKFPGWVLAQSHRSALDRV